MGASLGCGGSAAAQPADEGLAAAQPAEGTTETDLSKGLTPGPSRRQVMTLASARLSKHSLERSRALFEDYKVAVRRSESEDGELRGSGLAKSTLRELLPDVDDALFNYAWGLFDPKDTGNVKAADFISTMAIILTMPAADLNEQVESCFLMFDHRAKGHLTYTEFTSMVEATIRLNLARMLRTEAGERQVEAHLASEFSKENLDFWRMVRAYRLTPAPNRAAEAKAIIARFITTDADEEINLPFSIKQLLLDSYASADPTLPCDSELFAEAEHEIFKLMERDAFTRFKGDASKSKRSLDEFFKAADKANDGVVSFDEYRSWVQSDPQVLYFFSLLSESVRSLLQDAEARRSKMVVEAASAC